MGSIIKIAKTIVKTADRITMHATNGDICLNAAKSVNLSSKDKIEFGNYNPPELENTDKLLVTKVEGPDTIALGSTYTFIATQFNRAISDLRELEKVKWAYQLDDEEIRDFPNPNGEIIGKYAVKKAYFHTSLEENKKIRIFAYFQSPSKNSSVEATIHFEKIELFLLFYVDEWDTGTKMFKEAAQTRLQNIKNASYYDPEIHKVHCPPIQTIDEIIEIVPKYYEKYGGKHKVVVKEMGVFSHSGNDGPIAYDKKIKICPLTPKAFQMALCGWEKIDLLWAEEDSKCVFYGCNSGSSSNGFAQRISKLANFKDVEVWGQSDFSYPSFLPDYRITSFARSTPIIGGMGWDVGKTYMVGGNKGEGYDAIHGGSQLEFKNQEVLDAHPKANPMHCFKNGTKVRTTHQGYFNDHRKHEKVSHY